MVQPSFDVDAVWEDLTPLVHDVLGPEPIILSRPLTLFAVAAGEIPSLLEAGAAAVAGAAAINLRLAGGGILRGGALLAGSRLAIAGVHYQVAVDAPLAAGALPTVAIAPPLAAALGAGAVVELTAGPSWTFENGFVESIIREELKNILGSQLAMWVSLPTRDAPVEPRVGDNILRPKTGQTGRVVSEVTAVGGCWDLLVGGSKKRSA